MPPSTQDTIQFLPLTISMVGMMLTDPVTIFRVLFQVRKLRLCMFAEFAVCMDSALHLVLR